jgi:hypothetical protein
MRSYCDRIVVIGQGRSCARNDPDAVTAPRAPDPRRNFDRYRALGGPPHVRAAREGRLGGGAPLCKFFDRMGQIVEVPAQLFEGEVECKDAFHGVVRQGVDRALAPRAAISAV